MKKFTFMLLAAFVAVTCFAQKPLAKAERFLPKVQTSQVLSKVKAQRTLPMGQFKAPKKAAEDYVVITEQPEGELITYTRSGGHYYVSEGSLYYENQSGAIDIVWGADNKVYFKDIVCGMGVNTWVEGTLSGDGSTITVPLGQNLIYVESYDACIAIQLINYVAGSGFSVDTEATVVTFTIEDDVLSMQGTGFTSVSLGAVWTDDGTIQDYGDYESVYTPGEPEPLKVVELPEGVEVNEYVMTYDGGSAPVNVAVDGNDVYFQGMSQYCPEAWVKGTKDGNVVTFAAMQYMGEYGTYGSSYFFYNGETVFTYDADADTYSAEGQVYGVLGGRYYDGNYTNPVIAPVVEKAVMPADPEVTDFSDSSYGYIVEFNVPLMDVNGDPIVASKLSYIIYTDTEGVIEPLTFTPATHSRLTENITEIPYGFTEGYDFYADLIYLNDLYSEDWNKIGIQSIYRGGGEENVTEIQWYTIKEYAIQNYTFNFNKMDVPTSATGVTDGDILEPKTLQEKVVSLTISPKDGSSTENRFWSTSAGPQLRVYSGTLTFNVPDGYGITEIKFNHNGKWGANTINEVVISNDADNKVATWTLAEGKEPASEVVVAIAANSQINSIDVTVELIPDELVELPEGVEAEAWALEGFYSDGSDGADVFRATEVAFDGTDIYVKGLAYWFEDAWLKGTIDAEAGIATFPSGQFVGEDDYGKEYMVGYDDDFCDIQYVYDAEAKTLTQETPYIMESQSKSGLDEEGELAFWGLWEVSYLHAGEPMALEPVEVPDGLVTDTYIFTANEWVEESDGDGARRLKAPRKAMVLEPYSKQLQVGFDGNDVYFKGLTDNTADMWAKGTLSGDGKTVTIPASQYLGFLSSWSSTYDYYVTAVDDNFKLVDIVFNYDADTNTFTTDQTIIVNGSMFVYYPYQIFSDVEITKMPEFAATPADPSIEGYKLEGVSYPYINFAIPAQDVDGNDILTSKLFYTVWIEKDGVEQPFVVLADEYSYVEEDWTEVPYDWDDSYDIYKGGSKFYINPTDVIPSWTKFGIQSIYYGGGECNKSNIVWMDNPVYDPTTAITDVNFNNQKVVIFDLQGRRVAAPAKGLYIVNGKKVVLK